MTALFYDMMHKKMEVYVVDMIAKPKTKEAHITNLKKIFWPIKEILTLNSTQVYVHLEQLHGNCSGSWKVRKGLKLIEQR